MYKRWDLFYFSLFLFEFDLQRIIRVRKNKLDLSHWPSGNQKKIWERDQTWSKGSMMPTTSQIMGRGKEKN
jgi:hypothetical protein